MIVNLLKHVVIPATCFSSLTMNAQNIVVGVPEKSDTIFMDINWQPCAKRKASYYRVGEKTNGGYLVKDYYINHTLQMSAFTFSKDSIIKEGKATYYNINGYKSSEREFKNNKPFGISTWYYLNETDSAVYTYPANGESVLLRSNSCRLPEYHDDGFEATEVPYFAGGSNMREFIKANLKYPPDALAKKQYGQTIVTFIVTKDGFIEGVKVNYSSGHDSLDEEALRIVKSFPRCKPGRLNGGRVRVEMLVPVKFVLPVK